MRLNEKIGLLSYGVAFVILFDCITGNPSVWHLILVGIFGNIGYMFLSFWGLTTFNDKYEHQ